MLGLVSSLLAAITISITPLPGQEIPTTCDGWAAMNRYWQTMIMNMGIDTKNTCEKENFKSDKDFDANLVACYVKSQIFIEYVDDYKKFQKRMSDTCTLL